MAQGIPMLHVIFLLAHLSFSCHGVLSTQLTRQSDGRPGVGILPTADDESMYSRRPREALANLLGILMPAAAFNARLHHMDMGSFGQLRSVVRLSANEPEPDTELRLQDAMDRTSSKARAAFTAAVNSIDPSGLDPTRPDVLAALIAAEEQPLEDPETITSEIYAQLGQLVAAVRVRLQLASILGSDDVDSAKARSISECVSQTLFGTREDDSELNPNTFQADSENPSDPQNFLIDKVLDRKVGSGLALSFVYAVVSEQLGCRLAGFNGALAYRIVNRCLMSPPGEDLPLVISLRGDGKILSLAEAVDRLKTEQSISTPEMTTVLVEAEMDQVTAAHPLAWAAMMLRCLLKIYLDNKDKVRALGVAERLRIIGEAQPEVTTIQEQVFASCYIAKCVHDLAWYQRIPEARAMVVAEIKKGYLSSDRYLADGKPTSNLRKHLWDAYDLVRPPTIEEAGRSQYPSC